MQLRWAFIVALTSSMLHAGDVEPPVWHYATERPANGWETPGFDDKGRKSGLGGFGGQGEKNTPSGG